jgi:hypothetical protein
VNDPTAFTLPVIAVLSLSKESNLLRVPITSSAMAFVLSKESNLLRVPITSSAMAFVLPPEE